MRDDSVSRKGRRLPQLACINSNPHNDMKKIILAISMALLAVACDGLSQRGSKIQIPEPSDVVMYQVNPRNFAPEDSFNAFATHLDSVKTLGANVLWFMPIYEIGALKSVNSPYSIKDYRSVNPEFGTLEDFKNLVSESHKRGVIVIIDWVANHTSWDSQWIYDHPEWYTHDEAGEIISPEGTGWNDVADLDFSNPAMCQEMIDAMKFWVEEIGVDGFRCDAADYVPYEFWEDCLKQLRAIEGKELLMLAEGQRKDHFDAGFDMNYAWGWLSSLRRVYNGNTFNRQAAGGPGQGRRGGGPVPVSSLFEADSLEYAGLPDGRVKLRFTTNHDECVKMSPIREFFSPEGSMAAFVATAFIHGGVLVYGSQEVGYPGKINFFNYVEIDWTANSQMYKEYCDLMKVYNTQPALRKGSVVPYPDDNVLVFERVYGDDKVLVVINMRDTQQHVALPEAWKGRTCTDLVSGEKVTLASQTDLLRPFEYYVVK